MEKHVLWGALASALVLASCNAGKGSVTENELKGNWVEVMPVNLQIVQGVTLEEGGKATSIGMATLKYERWKLTGGTRLILEGKSRILIPTRLFSLRLVRMLLCLMKAVSV